MLATVAEVADSELAVDVTVRTGREEEVDETRLLELEVVLVIMEEEGVDEVEAEERPEEDATLEDEAEVLED